uniref:Uncharacterized protein n=1 Tax=Pararge aegeria TaxID=116150 RepID=S4PJJ4_9NEOP
MQAITVPNFVKVSSVDKLEECEMVTQTDKYLRISMDMKDFYRMIKPMHQSKSSKTSENCPSPLIACDPFYNASFFTY